MEDMADGSGEIANKIFIDTLPVARYLLSSSSEPPAGGDMAWENLKLKLSGMPRLYEL